MWVEINDNEKILNIDKIADIPIDYNEPMFVPITILYDYFKQYFDIICYRKIIAIVGYNC